MGVISSMWSRSNRYERRPPGEAMDALDPAPTRSALPTISARPRASRRSRHAPEKGHTRGRVVHDRFRLPATRRRIPRPETFRARPPGGTSPGHPGGTALHWGRAEARGHRYPCLVGSNAALDTADLASRRRRELRARRPIRRRHLPGVDALRPRWRTPHAGCAPCAGGSRRRASPTAPSARISLARSDVHLRHLAPLLRPPLTEVRVAGRDMKPLIGRVLSASAILAAVALGIVVW